MRFPSLVIAAACLVASAPAEAQDGSCGPPADLGPIEVTPASGANLVPLNAVVKVRYSPGWFTSDTTPAETVELTTPDMMPVPGTIQIVPPDILYFLPDEPLEPSTAYVGHASGAAGLEFAFLTGTTHDTQAPSFGSDSVGFTSRVADTSCTSPNGGRRIGLTIYGTEDDGPLTSLEYYLYLTRAPGVTAPVLLTRERGTNVDTMLLAFELPPERLSGRVCVALVVADGLEQSATWGTPLCFDPIDDFRFRGLCAASAGSHPNGAVPWGVLAGLVVLRRMRRRSSN